MSNHMQNENSHNEEYILHIFNAQGDVRYPVMKDYFHLSDDDIYKTISYESNLLKESLALKGISYDDLKGALLPNQDKNKYEICFVFDSMQISYSHYGCFVFSHLLSLLDKNSTYSILCGDYIDILEQVPNSQLHLKSSLFEILITNNIINYQHSNQFFLIYFNRLTAGQHKKIVDGLSQYSWYIGYADLTHYSLFKSYISYILTNIFIKYRNQIIAPHPVDYDSEENVNIFGYPLEEYGYKIISINEESFSSFLSYKIESDVPDETDISFSFNALFPRFNSFDRLKFMVDDSKWYDYLTAEGKKGPILNALGYGKSDKERFIREVYKRICSSYIYKLERKQYEGQWIWKFCVCIDMPTIHGNYRKTTVVLKYFPSIGEMHIITIT